MYGFGEEQKVLLFVFQNLSCTVTCFSAPILYFPSFTYFTRLKFS